MIRLCTRFSWLVLCLVAVGTAGAQTSPLSPLALTSRATVVATGRVAAVSSAWDAATRILYTYVTVDVRETLKGQPSTRLVLKQIGGVTSTIGLHVDGQATFSPGEDVLLFLAARRDGTLQTVALGDGKWALVPDLATGDTVALRHAGSTPTAAPAGATEAPLRLEDVRAWSAADDPQASYVAVPPERATAAVEGQAAAAYEYLPTDGYPARWHEADDGITVPIDVGLGAVPAASASAVDAAAAQWSNAGSALRLARSGSSSGCAAAFATDGRIRVGTDDACPDVAQDWVVGGGYYTQGDLRTVGGVTFQKFVAGFAVVDTAGAQATSPGCFQDAVTHGLGHAIGLGHSGGDAIMNAGIPAGCSSGPRGLGSDDINVVRDIYREQPNGGQLPDAPTAVGVSVVASTVTISWTPATSGGIAQSYVVEAGTAPGVVNIGAIPSPGTGTSLVVGGVPPGVYWVRVRARNALGTSAGTSPDAQVVVGPCEAPGTPTAFTAAGSDTLASFTWAPPASGGAVQGYRLEVGSAAGLSNLLVLPLPATPTSFQANGPYGTYFTRLRATNACGVSEASVERQIVLAPCTAAPLAPTNLQFSVSPQRVVTLTWTPPAGGQPPRDYVVYVGSAPGGSDILVYGTGSAVPSLVATAPPQTYFVRVVARNACGQSATATNEQTVVVP
jgi:hypothetical protein